MKTAENFDIAIIGAEPAGLRAAEIAAACGANVVLIDKSASNLGDSGLYNGRVISQALIYAAGQAGGSWLKAKRHVNSVIAHMQSQQLKPEEYAPKGIKILFGPFTMRGKNQIQVGREVITTKKIIIATGSEPRIPNITGLKKAPYATNESVFNLKSRPKNLAIIGAGPVGIELAFAFSKLGSRVNIIDHNSRILKEVDEQAANMVTLALKKAKVSVCTSASIPKVTSTTNRFTLQVSQFNNKHELAVDTVLVAAGRTPNLLEGLKAAGVKSGEKGIIVDKNWRTTNPSIYAVGDCTGFPLKFAHVAIDAATHATRHALTNKKAAGLCHPYVFFTEPEIAQVGPTEAQLTVDDVKYTVHNLNFDDNHKAYTTETSGFIKVLTNKKGKILSATITGKQAGELIGYLAAAVNRGSYLDELAELSLPYPTLSYGLKQLAFEVTFKKSKIREFFKNYLRR